MAHLFCKRLLRLRDCSRNELQLLALAQGGFAATSGSRKSAICASGQPSELPRKARRTLILAEETRQRQPGAQGPKK